MCYILLNQEIKHHSDESGVANMPANVQQLRICYILLSI